MTRHSAKQREYSAWSITSRMSLQSQKMLILPLMQKQERSRKQTRRSMLERQQRLSQVHSMSTLFPIISIAIQDANRDLIIIGFWLMQEEGIDLSPAVLKNMTSGKVSKEHSKDIICLEFSMDGSRLYSCDETTVNIYDTTSAKKIKTVFLKTLEIVRLYPTHNNDAILVATKKDNIVLYWSIHENAIIKLFRGHTDQITNLQISPRDDSFLTSSRDQSVRLWDLNSNHNSALSILDLYEYSTCSYPVASFDPQGLIFVVAFTEVLNNTTVCRICLYDKAKYQDGAFESWTKDYSEIKILKFSNCGFFILCATADNMIVILDSYKGQEKQRFTNFQNENSIIECSFTPDSKYIISGSENGLVHIWQISTKQKIAELAGHVEKSQVVKFSPRHCLIVSGGRNIFWWQPRHK